MKLAAEKRTDLKAAALRAGGRIPGVVYNKELNVPVSVELRAFDKVFREQGTSSIIDLDIGGENHEVLVKAVQMNKRRRVPLHVDFYAITAGQTVEVYVPLEFVGKPIGAKEGGRLLVHAREIHISILPSLIPQHLEVDISALEIGDAIHLEDVTKLFPSEAEFLDELERTLVTVIPPRVEEEIEESEEESEEPEVIGKGGEDEEDEDKDEE